MLGQSTQSEMLQKQSAEPSVSITLPTASKLSVDKVKMPTANMDELTQYFLKNGAKLSPAVRTAFTCRTPAQKNCLGRMAGSSALTAYVIALSEARVHALPCANCRRRSALSGRGMPIQRSRPRL